MEEDIGGRTRRVRVGGRNRGVVPGPSGGSSTQGVNTRVGVTGNKPARAWILTVAAHCFTPYQPDGVKYIRGQLESSESGFLHWQVRS